MQDAFAEAAEAIRRKKPGALRTIVDAHPNLVSQTDEHGDRLLDLTLSYANDPSADLELWTSTPCAAVLVDAGAEVAESTYMRAMATGDTPMIRMFLAKNAIPTELRTVAAAGDDTAIDAMSANASPEDIAEAFYYACKHGHADGARRLVAAFGHEDGDDDALVALMLDHRGGTHLTAFYSPARRGRALRLHIAMNANDTESFAQILAADPALLTDDYEELQLEILGTCAYTRKPAIARALLDAGASISRPPVPESRALTWAIDYGCSEMIELLLELYEPRDDLPTWAGLGDLDRVTAFFDETGALRPGSALVYPENDTSGDASRILSHALGLACMNRNIDVATYLVDRGADIDGVWGQHEPATVLHELAGNGVVESIAWILGRGASVTARDVRFGGTALDWSVYCGRDEARALLEAPTVEADLVAAIEYGCVDDVVAHIGRGSDVNAALDYIAVQSVTPLCFAVRRGDAAMVQALLEAGAHATHLDSNGNGPLHRLDATTADAEAIRTLVHRHSEPPS